MGGMEWLRPAAVAGTFYPGDPAELQRELERCLGGPPPPPEAGDPERFVIAPHAGTIYSGAIAGALYRRVRVPDRVVVLAVDHRGAGEPCGIWPRGAWRTPLGDLAVDEELAARLMETTPELVADRVAHEREHSLEVQLPFLRARNPAARIVPIAFGPLPPEDCVAVGRNLARALAAAPDALLLASTDLSHYLPAAEAREQDRRAIARIEAVDAAGLVRTVRREGISMCGVVPTAVLLAAAAALGARLAEVVAYGNSGDRSGDYRSVVGYASLIVR